MSGEREVGGKPAGDRREQRPREPNPKAVTRPPADKMMRPAGGKGYVTK